jgi:hypothetical protein
VSRVKGYVQKIEKETRQYLKEEANELGLYYVMCPSESVARLLLGRIKDIRKCSFITRTSHE